MNPNQLLFIGGVLIGGILLIVTGFLFKKNPPKKINPLYGYRSKSSMKNQTRWDFAQCKSAKELIRSGIFLCATTVFGFIIPENKIYTLYIIGVIAILIILSAIFPIIQTERAIKNKFDKNE
ncbi:MAG: SdpI family protein [Mesonia hippocampi]|uniref:Putative membrane protein n=1 Tax=Mesonia hippocampi TaxID=1628250 RepID=A0A840EMQ1_9FLAO|nr:SdpI family protein [Mesonia hippocampi]MBB4118385.1 putative membrane protein [Mesonia hippocampi]